MSDVSPASAPATTPAAPPAAAPPTAAPTVGTTDLLGAQLSPEAAREQIASRISDKEFGKRLLAKEPAAFAEWSALHKAAYPSAQQIASAEDVNSQAAARNEEQWNTYFGWLKQRFALTPENEAEIRGGVIRSEIHQWAREEKDRLIHDKGWYKRLLDGDRQASADWERIKLMLSLRPVKP